MHCTAIDTLERRWFARLPEHQAPSVADPIRRDWYAPSGPGCGIKLRDGRLEVKQLLGERGAYQRWRKWTLPDECSSSIASSAWCAVDKQRRLRHDQIDGIQVQTETTWIRCVYGTWHSSAVELSGAIPDELPQAIQHLVDQHMRASASAGEHRWQASYPAWLASLQTGEIGAGEGL